MVVYASHRYVDRGNAGAYLLRYNASGGSVGVGVAVGQAVRTSLIVVVVITLFISLAVYGASGNFNLSG